MSGIWTILTRPSLLASRFSDRPATTAMLAFEADVMSPPNFDAPSSPSSPTHETVLVNLSQNTVTVI
jgi:hypothetical protein